MSNYVSAKKTVQTRTDLKVRIYDGILTHKNPTCNQCGKVSNSLYVGGRKDRISNIFICEICSILYTLPQKPKCDIVKQEFSQNLLTKTEVNQIE